MQKRAWPKHLTREHKDNRDQLAGSENELRKIQIFTPIK